MKKFLVIWTLIAAIVTTLFFIGAKKHLLASQNEWVNKYNGRVSANLKIKAPTSNDDFWEYNEKYNLLNNVINPTVLFGMLFFGIPVSIASLFLIKTHLERFLVIWTILAVIFTTFWFMSSQDSLLETKKRWVAMHNIRAEEHKTVKDIYWEDGEHNFLDNVIFPTAKFGTLFFGIPVALACLISIALRKNNTAS